jgi:quinol monooxygenase YgiN
MMVSHPVHTQTKETLMKIGIVALLEAKPGKEADVAALLEGAVTLARQEGATLTWYAFKTGPRNFGIFDTFADETGRKAHLEGQIAKALMGRADELLAVPPDLRMADIIAVK